MLNQTLVAKIDASIIFGTSKMEYINVNLTVHCHTEYTSMCLVSDLIVSMSREELYFFLFTALCTGKPKKMKWKAILSYFNLNSREI